MEFYGNKYYGKTSEHMRPRTELRGIKTVLPSPVFSPLRRVLQPSLTLWNWQGFWRVTTCYVRTKDCFVVVKFSYTYR